MLHHLKKEKTEKKVKIEQINEAKKWNSDKIKVVVSIEQKKTGQKKLHTCCSYNPHKSNTFKHLDDVEDAMDICRCSNTTDFLL